MEDVISVEYVPHRESATKSCRKLIIMNFRLISKTYTLNDLHIINLEMYDNV